MSLSRQSFWWKWDEHAINTGGEEGGKEKTAGGWSERREEIWDGFGRMIGEEGR